MLVDVTPLGITGKIAEADAGGVRHHRQQEHDPVRRAQAAGSVRHPHRHARPDHPRHAARGGRDAAFAIGGCGCLDLRPNCQAYDVSNACLGLLTGVLQVANLIELGQIQAGLVVGTEDCRALLESTIGQLNADESLTRETVKPAFASLTIGSASAAVLLVHRDISQTGNRLAFGAARAHTAHYELCQGGHDGSTAGTILMQTDSERLLAEGLAAGAATFDDLLTASEWSRDELHRTICHQVGGTHRKLMLQSLGLPPGRDYVTYPWLGNTGSVALPITLALAIEDGFVQPHERIALLGIGSGINSIMLGVQWSKSLVARGQAIHPARPHFLPAATTPAESLS
jgi:acyl-CoA:acyl-CoA alkyltransferase